MSWKKGGGVPIAGALACAAVMLLLPAEDSPLGSGLVGGLVGGLARADEAAGVTGPSCVIKGTFPVAKGTQLFDARTGGRVIANFSGAAVPMQLSDLGADITSSRGRLATSNGGGSLRLEGFIAVPTIPAFTLRDLPVVAGHVWISSAQKVKLVKGAPGSVTSELTIAGSQGQTVRAAAACDAYSLQKGTPTRLDVPGNGRGYLMKGASIELFADAGGDTIFTLRMTDGGGQLFWSTESRSGFVHVMSRGDVTIDAWARAGALEPLKKGEMMDQLIPPSSAITGAQLTLDKSPPLVKATRDIRVRSRRDEKEKSIGVIEAGAEVYLMETVAGWTNVLPKGLGVTPPDDGGFWIPSSEAPK